jgi:hypothetical protein
VLSSLDIACRCYPQDGRQLPICCEVTETVSPVERHHAPRLESMVFPAQAFECGGMGGSAGSVRDCVVDIAIHGWAIAAWKPTSQIAAAHEVSQRRRGRVATLRGCVERMNKRLQSCRVGWFGDYLGGDEGVGAHQ